MAKAAAHHKALEVLRRVVRIYPPVERQTSTQLQRGMIQGVALNEWWRRANTKQVNHIRRRKETDLVKVSRKVWALGPGLIPNKFLDTFGTE